MRIKLLIVAVGAIAWYRIFYLLLESDKGWIGGIAAAVACFLVLGFGWQAANESNLS